MQKVSFKLKRLIAFVSLGVVLLLAGLFFVGCGESAAAKLTITPDKTNITLFAGESEEVTFTLGNKEKGVDSLINFSLIDSTVASSESEHVLLEVVSQQDTQTTVRLTGKSGGKTTLVATTNEGNKQAFVYIDVKQYSSSLSLKDDVLLYVSNTTDFVPSEEMYNFEENSTERNLTFHKTEVENEISDENQFVSVKLTYDQQNNQNIITFVKENGETFGDTVVSLGSQINFMARYENGQTLEISSLRSYFTVLTGLGDDAIQITLNSQPVDLQQGLTIIANDIEGRQEVELVVKVPSYIANLGAVNEQNFIQFEDIVKDGGVLTISREKVREGDPLFEAGFATYRYKITSATIQACSTGIDFKLFYMIDGQSFENAQDEAVSQKLTLPVQIKVAPSRVVVNGYEETAVENHYNFYNFYDGDYGWQQFNVEVFRTDSSFDYVEMTFEDDVVVTYKGREASSPLHIDNVREPVYVRGSKTAVPTEQEKSIQFKVVSEYITGGDITYSVNYKISTGATVLKFDDSNKPYEYSVNNDNTGIFISTSQGRQTFTHLVTDYDFSFATPSFHDGDSSCVSVQFVSNEEEQLADENVVLLRVEPLKKGIATYKITLDNGVSKLITFRVIDTFDSLSVNLSGVGNDGVITYEKVEPDQDEELGEISDQMNVVVQNSSTDTEVTYGKRATFELSSSHGNTIFKDIDYSFSEEGLFGIAENGKAIYSVSSFTFGQTVLDFEVTGEIVNDFVKEEQTRYARVNLTSAVPVSSFNIYKNSETTPAHNVSLFVGNNVSDSSLQTVTFTTSLLPSIAYGFYEASADEITGEITGEMKNDSFKQEYIYWTLNDTTSAYYMNNQPATTMVYGNTYKIGNSADNYFGIFDTTKMTFTVNKNYGFTFNFTLFASLRQYGVAKYFPITIEGEAYDNVTNIYTNLDQQSNLIFSPTQTNFEIGVFLNPTTATDKGIVVRYISANENTQDLLINLPEPISSSDEQSGDVTLVKINDSGAWLVKVQLNSKILAINADQLGTLKGTLQIIPNAWFVDNKIVAGYENNVVSINFNYENGSEANPFWLQNAEDVKKIGDSAAAMKSHYRLETTIDMSGYASIFPLGKNLDEKDRAFSGSIISQSGSAAIKGLNITEGVDGCYGMFSEVSGKISGIAFEGSINIPAAERNANIGLVCGVLSGELGNDFVISENSNGETKEVTITGSVSARILSSNISLASGNIGGLVGVNNGLIYNMNVIFEDEMQVSGNAQTYVGGIVGKNGGVIKGYSEQQRAQLFGYSAYSVYALISAMSEDDSMLSCVGGVSGYSDGNGGITEILAGGELFGDSVGGIVETISSGELYNIITRVMVRGKQVALVGVTVGDSVKCPPNNTIPENSYIKIQATDDGAHLGIYASMGVLFATQSPYQDMQDRNSRIAFLNSNISCSEENGYEFSSYITREKIDNPTQANIDNNYTLEQYFADFIVVNEVAKNVIDYQDFAKKTTSLNIQPNEKNGFYAMTPVDDNVENAKTVINMFYFEAAGSYQNGEFTTSDLYKAQEALQPLNTLNIGDDLYPFTVEGSDLTITSLSPKLQISETGQIIVKGTGLARVEISSLLNQKQNETIYLNIINYFNVLSYINGTETGIFNVGDLTLGNNSSFKVYSNSGVNVLVSPSYILDQSSTNETGIFIDRDGLVHVDGKLIQLAKSDSVSVSVTLPEDKTELQYGYYTTTQDGITFVKKTTASVSSENMVDTINLSASINTTVDGVNYTLGITTLNGVTINYFEGATAINTKKDKYVLTPSNAVTDVVMITSDDSDDVLSDENEQYFKIVDESGKESGLFDVSITKQSDLTFNLNISVDKTSAEFENRREENIYKTYYLRLCAKSNPNTVLKEIEIALHKENVDTISVINYPEVSSLLESDFVLPGRSGVLSVTLTPIDADFEYVEITNDAINNLQGASSASFVLGYMDENLKFVEVSGAAVINGGIRISRDVLENMQNAAEEKFYQGQFYVRYMFSNLNVEDGQSVGINITVKQNDQLLTEKLVYKLYKQDLVSIDFADYPGKTQVARGLTYDMKITAVGYDPQTIEVTSSNPQLAQVAYDKETGKCTLTITNDTIDYNNNNNKFKITLQASKVNQFGEIIPETDELDLQILEFVINYAYNETNQDIISGMNNGVIDMAVGEKNDVAVAFNDMIEYNQANTTVDAYVTNFLNELTNFGVWTLYTDLNVNNAYGIPVHTLPLDKEKATSSVFGSDVEIVTPYLKTSGYSVTTLKTHQPENGRYFFSFEARFKIDNGLYVAVADWEDTDVGLQKVYTEFKVDSYMHGSEQSPNPVSSYEEFLAMEAGGYYILLSDITIPANQFQPLNTEIAYFDGNNFKFIFDSAEYNIADASYAGLFGTVGTQTVLKNITIQVGGENTNAVSFVSNSAMNVSFGLVAGLNNGAITNASVTTLEGNSVHLTFASSTPASEGYYFGGVAGQNTGFITNSRSSINASSLVSMGGLVGLNQGTIASSAFTKGLLECRSTYNDVFKMGGLVAVNSENANILTSYVSGEVTANKVYSDGTSSMLNSSVQVGGFVHTNQGSIEDSYSNIPILTSSRSAGFVYTNTARIERCFSTSKITGDNSATNYYFAGDGEGTFEDCYYIKGNMINVTLSPLSHEGVSALEYNEDDGQVTKNDFANLTTYFANYAYSTSKSYNAVWFYSDGAVTDKFNGMQFAGGRLELVSANLVATSQKENIGTTTDANGVTVYQYATVDGTPEDGSETNPYIIYSAQTLESYLVTPNKIASKNYRIICDITYTDFTVDYTGLYDIDLRGNLEGNGSTISEIQLVSSKQSDNAGLFGKITGQSNINASVMNLNIVPQEVAFTNSNIVGTLAGTVQNANIYNINVYGSSSGQDINESDELVTVTGKNIVGGVVGLTLGGYNIKNVNSMISAFATNVPSLKTNVDYESEALSELSFAGGVVGYLGGRGSLKNATITNGTINILAAKAGLMFGGIAAQASADNVFVNVNASMQIKAYKYGGFISGEIKGSLSNAYVYGYGVTGETFVLQPYVPNGVGGIAGLLRDGGKIDTAYMNQGFVISEETSAAIEIDTVDYVGGVVGRVEGNNNKISKVLVDASLTGRSTVGGIVGSVAQNGYIIIDEVAIKKSTFLLQGQTALPVMGGMIGQINLNAVVSISNSYSQADLTIETYTYSTQITANYGGIVGANSGTLSLSNIYTTSVYNLKLEDKNSADATGVVGGVQAGSPPSYFSVGNRYFAINPKTYLGWVNGGAPNPERYWDTDTTKQEVEYRFSGSNLTVTNVINSSLQSAYANTNCNFDLLGYGYTSIQARKFNSAIEINQTEFGKDVYSLNVEKGIINDGDEPLDIAEALEAFYNFGDSSIWNRSATAFSTLRFESTLRI